MGNKSPPPNFAGVVEEYCTDFMFVQDLLVGTGSVAFPTINSERFSNISCGFFC